MSGLSDNRRRHQSKPVTVCKCDGVLARSDSDEIYINTVLATAEHCWITIHTAVNPKDRDTFLDLQTWHEDSLVDYRPSAAGLYELRLEVDGVEIELDFSTGLNGGGIDDETGRIHWTHSLVFPIAPSQRTARLLLNWDAQGLTGEHVIDLEHVAQSVIEGAY